MKAECLRQYLPAALFIAVAAANMACAPSGSQATALSSQPAAAGPTSASSSLPSIGTVATAGTGLGTLGGSGGDPLPTSSPQATPPPVATPAPPPPPTPTPVVLPPAQPTPVACSASAGQSCQKGTQTLPGCPSTPGQVQGCASFWGVYYNSPNGCDPNSAPEWIEQEFDGTNEFGRGQNTSQTIPNPLAWAYDGDASNGYHCTYIGFAGEGDPFQNTPDGVCRQQPNNPGNWSKVTAGTGCSYVVPVNGTVQCDGSCN